MELEKVRLELHQTKDISTNTQHQLVNTQNQLVNTQNQLINTQNQLQQLEKIAQHPIVRALRKIRKLLIYLKKCLDK